MFQDRFMEVVDSRHHAKLRALAQTSIPIFRITAQSLPGANYWPDNAREVRRPSIC